MQPLGQSTVCLLLKQAQRFWLMAAAKSTHPDIQQKNNNQYINQYMQPTMANILQEWL